VRARVTAFVSGLVFAIGLGVSGMTQPAKVIAFLDVTGAWDPSLAFVMVGAIAVHMIFVRLSRRLSKPLWATSFATPAATAIDARIVGGAALFGLGWGAAGYCPGPAVVALAGLSTSAFVFFGTMVAGMVIAQSLFQRGDPRSPRDGGVSNMAAAGEHGLIGNRFG
jgi:uncharacterized membrane protein YedE/YeeE